MGQNILGSGIIVLLFHLSLLRFHVDFYWGGLCQKYCKGKKSKEEHKNPKWLARDQGSRMYSQWLTSNLWLDHLGRSRIYEAYLSEWAMTKPKRSYPCGSTKLSHVLLVWFWWMCLFDQLSWLAKGLILRWFVPIHFIGPHMSTQPIKLKAMPV